MPKETDLRDEFNSVVGDAFAGNPTSAAQAYDVAKDYYAGLMARKGNTSGEYDSDMWTEAINAATGGIYDYNGQGSVLLPWGMSEDNFDKEVSKAWQEQIVDKGIKAPTGDYGLQTHGDALYLVKLGNGYLLDKQGRPVVLSLEQASQNVRLADLPQ